MSLHLEFEPHSWYKGFAIKHDPNHNDACEWDYKYTDGKLCTIHNRIVHPWDNFCEDYVPKWQGFTDNGNTYGVHELGADTLAELRAKITEYRQREAERMARLYSEVNNV